MLHILIRWGNLWRVMATAMKLCMIYRQVGCGRGQIIDFIENFEIFGNFENFEIFVTPIEQSLRGQTTKREVYSKLTLQPARAVSNE